MRRKLILKVDDKRVGISIRKRTEEEARLKPVAQVFALRFQSNPLSRRARPLMKRIIAALVLPMALPAFGQANAGELLLKVTDPAGLGVKTQVQIVSEAHQYSSILTTDPQGALDIQHLPYGLYRVEIRHTGFAIASEQIEIHSSLPMHDAIQLKLATTESVFVSTSDTLVDPDQAGSVNEIGRKEIQDRVSSIPGRSVEDLVLSQPGWLYMGNAVLHPRGSEYQTQFVIDGIPLIDNRAPSFGPAIEADDIQSMSIYTSGIPAEYGRKMGGVVEINTLQNTEPGFHGNVVLSGGSFSSAGSFARGQYTWGENTLGGSASSSMTDHYLNPVVVENYSNTGTLGDFSGDYRRDLTPNDQLSLSARHELSRYDLPNEIGQQQAGQRLTGDNFETMGIASYQHNFSSDALANLRGMVRDNSNDFYSNQYATPIQVFQHNWFREGYFNSGFTLDRGRHEWTAGIESDNLSLHENFRYHITDPIQFDSNTPLAFSFIQIRPDLEQSAFVQDHIRMGKWTANVGLRWDHYQLILNRQGVEPRLAIARYFPAANLVLHFSYDRVFQTPSFENILLSSSTAAAGLDTTSVQLPVRPAQGNYYEGGMTKVFLNKVKLDANYFRRSLTNFPDDDQIDNTTISYPIAFQKGIIYGGESKLEVHDWKRFSGFVSYAYQVANDWFPVVGGLFLGDDAVIPTSGHLPISMDQRHTSRGRLVYQVNRRIWIAGGVQYDSGLPFEFKCPDGETRSDCIDGDTHIYGPEVINRLNFVRERIYPAFKVRASAGITVYMSKRMNINFQADGENLSNITDVIVFSGLFSANAIGPPRSFALRLTTTF
jgi:hypothetical protein